MCFGVLILDGIDVNISSYLGPALITHWHITRAEYGPVLTGGLVGLALGSLTAGPLGDRVGRRRVIAAPLGFYALMNALLFEHTLPTCPRGVSWRLLTLPVLRTSRISPPSSRGPNSTTGP